MNKTRSSGKHEEFTIPELDELAKNYAPIGTDWSPDADKVLWKYYYKVDILDMQKYLAKHYPPKRSVGAIQKHYSELKRRGGV